MGYLLHDIILAAGIGIGATAVMDIWLTFLKSRGVKTLDFAFIGRWVGHLARGKVRHDAIARAQPIKGELALGWLMHYVTGIAFAGLLLGIVGMDWARIPTLLPALLVGIPTVVIPLFAIRPCCPHCWSASLRWSSPCSRSSPPWAPASRPPERPPR